MSNPFQNEKGQGLIEYLILVALMGVATISVVKLLQRTVNTNMANSIKALQGDTSGRAQHERVQNNDFKKRDFSSFMNGAINPRQSSND
ncbi:MAG: hypothetical protein CL675_11755 [Bdellovibrionaceae bacterium]|nr:hypothetical protein [Pseudobdellovibrionaceae bacterium]